MSQPIKSEPVVKTEPGTERIPSASAAVPVTASPRYSADQGWQDIPLKACTEEEIQDIRYHILKFQTKQNVDIVNEFTKPVRLHRKDPRNIQFQLTRQELEQRKKEQEELKREREKLKLENEERVRKAKEEAMIDEGLTEAEREAIANNIGPNGIGLVNPDPPKNAAGNGTGANKNGSDLSQVAPDGGARKPRKNLFKRKTRQINLMDDNKRKLRYEEYYPWVLEDYDGKNVFVGNYEAGSSDTQHVLFVFDKDGFKMVPAEKVYKFTPRNKYATLTLEEAEAKMEKNSSVPRWLMKHMEDQLAVAGGGVATDSRFRHNTASSSSSASFMGPGGVGASGSSSRNNNGRRLVTVSGGGRSNDRDSDHDDLDFDEEFADDEEAPIMDGDEEENKLSEQKLKKEMLKAAHFDGQSDADVDDDDLDDLFETEKSRKVDKEGEKLRKVLNKTEGGVYESDDDDKLNPYLSKSDLESDDESDDEIKVKQEGELTIKDLQSQAQSEQQQQQQQQRNIFADNLGDGFILVRAPSSFLVNFPRGEWNPNVDSRKRPSPSLVSSSSPKKSKTSILNEEKAKSISPSPAPSATIDLNSAGPDGVLVTTKEVLDIVRDNPLTTKDLLVGLKNRVNAHRDNKQRIIAIVKHNLRLVDGKLVLKEDI